MSYFYNMKHTVEELSARLSTGKVRFQFKKKDGSIREAAGTTHKDTIPQASLSDSIRPQKQGVITFYDFTCEGWRSLQTSTEITILS